MKNEVFAKAITNIDDDLILEALETPLTVHHHRKWITACAAAACLVLICSVALLSRNSRFAVTAYGYGITEEPIRVETPAAVSDASRITQDIISVPLEISGKGKTQIRAVDGTIAVSSAKTNALLYSGQSCTVKGSFTAWWNIPQPDETMVYRLQLNTDITLLLSFDESTAQWFLRQQ